MTTADESTRLLFPNKNERGMKGRGGKWNVLKKAVKTETENDKNRHNSRNSMINVGQISGVRKPIRKWYRGLVIRQCCHSHLASKYLYNDMALNTFSVGLTAITSSAIFTSLSPSTTTAAAINQATEEDGGVADAVVVAASMANPIDLFTTNLALLAGIIAAFNTVLQGISRTLYYGQRGEQHLQAYKDFSRLRFKLENIIGDKPKYGDHENVDMSQLTNWIQKYEEVLETAPIIPQRTFEHVARDQDKKGLLWTKDTREGQEE